MIRVFQPADTAFTRNGDVVLRPLRAKVRKIFTTNTMASANPAYHLDGFN